MTAKEQLEQLVAELGEEDASRALELIQSSLQIGVPEPRKATAEPRRLPAFVGIGVSGRRDLSESVDELLADGFGR